MTPTTLALGDVAAERRRQDKKWGGQPGVDRVHPNEEYAVVLGEEYGEVCRAILEGQGANLREELIQVAAVAVAWVEQLDAIRRAAA